MNGTRVTAEQNAVLRREMEALRRSEGALRDFLETSSICLHWIGADGTILWANQADLDLLGYRLEELIGRNFAEFQADGPMFDDALARLRLGERLRDYPARLRHRDGSTRHVLINTSPLFEDGEFIHTRCFTRDVTALHEERDARQLLLWCSWLRLRIPWRIVRKWIGWARTGIAGSRPRCQR